MTGPVTIGGLAQSGRLLLVWCRCGHRVELTAEATRLPPETPVPGIANRFRCEKCGARNTAIDHPVQALMDPRQPGMTGRYPAF